MKTVKSILFALAFGLFIFGGSSFSQNGNGNGNDNSATVTYSQGIYGVFNGVSGVLDLETGTIVLPTNLNGMVQSGHVVPGQRVTLRTVTREGGRTVGAGQVTEIIA